MDFVMEYRKLRQKKTARPISQAVFDDYSDIMSRQ